MTRQHVAIFRRKTVGLLKIFFLFLFLFFVTFLSLFFLKQTLPKKKMISPLGVTTPGQENTDIHAVIDTLCQKYNFSCSQIVESNSDVSFVLSTGTDVIFSLHKDLEKQMASLQYTLAHLTIEGKRISRADFHFDRPVVSF